MADNSLIRVGVLTTKHNAVAQSNLPCGIVYQSKGLPIHIQKHHANCLSYIPAISSIIANPDYIGVNPKEPDSIELVKQLGANILVAVKLDKAKGHLYVASLYDITSAKLQARIMSGRLKPF